MAAGLTVARKGIEPAMERLGELLAKAGAGTEGRRDHRIGEPGEDRDRRRNRPSRVDQRLERAEDLATSLIPFRMALGLEAKAELLRDRYGNWIELKPVEIPKEEEKKKSEERIGNFIKARADLDTVLLVKF